MVGKCLTTDSQSPALIICKRARTRIMGANSICEHFDEDLWDLGKCRCRDVKFLKLEHTCLPGEPSMHVGLRWREGMQVFMVPIRLPLRCDTLTNF